MSLSKPVTKQARIQGQPAALVRSESVDLSRSIAEERGRRMGSRQTSSTDTPSDQTMTRHPKGHKVRTLDEIWKTMDSQDFLHLADTLVLGDVWVQPIAVEPAKGAFATVTFKQMVAAPHIKHRDANCKMSLEDLTKMLYLNDCIQYDMQNVERMSYDDWLKEKSSLCVKAKGMEEGSNRAKLCHFIITEDRSFTFYPAYLHGRFGVFFRKICYHSYKTAGEQQKLVNPAMIKCCATKGNFEYILEARFFPLPDEWFDSANPAATSMVDRCQPDDLPATLPESQVY